MRTRIAKIAVVLQFVIWVAFIAWSFVDPPFLPTNAWLDQTLGKASIVGACFSLFVVTLLESTEFRSAGSTAWKDRGVFARIALSLFLIAVNIWIARSFAAELLPFYLSNANAIAVHETAYVDRRITQRRRSGFTLQGEYSDQLFIPLKSTSARHCLDEGWLVDIYGNRGKWGIYLERVVVTDPIQGTEIEIDFKYGTEAVPSGCSSE